MNNILAKSDGTTLINHSKTVSEFAVEMGKQFLNEESLYLLNGIKLGSLLHDIGKVPLKFQNKLKKNSNSGKAKKNGFRHNEIGWAFLKEYLVIDRKILEIILDVVYWHHGISNKMNSHTHTKILDTITSKDISKMIKMSNLLLDGIDGVEIRDKECRSTETPEYYLSTDDADYDNPSRLICRACVIGSDRLVSEFSYDITKLTSSDIQKIVSNLNYRDLKIDITKHPYYGNGRFIAQENIINGVVNNTTIIKAPAGFGKTLLGLLWNFKRTNKLIWVCPRNVVAESVYRSIDEELNKIPNNKISLELFYSGEVIKSNNFFTEEFSSDIIVTNIDNYLAPQTNNTISNRLTSIINYDVIFDEYHELIGENGLFSAFVNLIKVRHTLTNSKTLLLSATPTNLHFLWDTLSNQTTILPSEDKHYSAPHSKKYKINILEDNPENVKTINNLHIYNSISKAQEQKNTHSKDKLFHSMFSKQDKKSKLDDICELYGKSSERALVKPNLIGTHIIQASMDVSFNHLYESVLSPESTLQRIGRCDRWGDFEGTPSINVFNYDNPSENRVRDVLYSNNLSNLWFDVLRGYDGLELTLDELYVIYNNFILNNRKQLKRFVDNKYVESLSKLSTIYPKKYYNINKGNNDNVVAGGNKLRCTGNETFFICKNSHNNGYCDPLSVRIYKNHGQDFSESGNILKKITRTMTELRKNNDDRFDYNEMLNMYKNTLTIDRVRGEGVNSKTPYIRFDKLYHSDLGLIDANF